jgi:hypothetical protein
MRASTSRRTPASAASLSTIPRRPSILVHTDAIYWHQPLWYRNFLYSEERDRGLDCVEDLAWPGVFRWGLTKREAAMELTAGGHDAAGKRTRDGRDGMPAPL